MRKDSLLQNYYYSKLPKAKVGMETGDPNQPYHPITNPQGYKVKLSDVLKVSEKNRQEALDTRPQIKQGHKELPYEKKAREERLRKEAQENSALAQTMGLFTPSGSNPAAGAIGAETFTNMNPLITGPIMSTSRLYGAGRSLVDDKTANPYFGSDKGVVGNVLGGLNLAGDIGMLRMGLRKPTGSFNPEPNPANRIEWSDFTERNGRVKQAWADAQKRKAGIPATSSDYWDYLKNLEKEKEAGDIIRSQKLFEPDPSASVDISEIVNNRGLVTPGYKSSLKVGPFWEKNKNQILGIMQGDATAEANAARLKFIKDAQTFKKNVIDVNDVSQSPNTLYQNIHQLIKEGNIRDAFPGNTETNTGNQMADHIIGFLKNNMSLTDAEAADLLHDYNPSNPFTNWSDARINNTTNILNQQRLASGLMWPTPNAEINIGGGKLPRFGTYSYAEKNPITNLSKTALHNLKNTDKALINNGPSWFDETIGKGNWKDVGMEMRGSMKQMGLDPANEQDVLKFVERFKAEQNANALKNYSGRPNVEDLFGGMNQNKYGGSIKEYGGPLVEYYKGKMTGPNMFAVGGPGDGKKSLPPIYTDDPRKVQAYNDSLVLSNFSKLQHQLEPTVTNWMNPFASNKTQRNKGQFILEKTAQDLVNNNPNINWELGRYAGTGAKFIKNSSKNPNIKKGYIMEQYYPEIWKDEIVPEYIDNQSPDITHKTINPVGHWWGRGQNNEYISPVQPYILQQKSQNKSGEYLSEKDYNKKYPPIYITNSKDPRIGQYTPTGNQFVYKPQSKPEPTLKRKVSMVEPISTQSSYTPSIRIPNIPNIEIPSVQQGKYRVEYFDPELKQETHRNFMTQAESDAYANELSKRNLSGVPSAGNITQRVQYANGGAVNLNSIIKQNREDRDNNYYSGGISKYEQGGQANKYYYNKGYGVPRFDEGGQGPCDPGYYYDVTAGKCLPLKATNLPLTTINEDETTTPIEQTSEEKRLALGLGNDAPSNESLKQGTVGSDSFLKNWYGQRIDDPRYGKVAQQRIAEIPKIQETPTTAADLKESNASAYYIQGGKKIYIDPNNPFSRGSTVQTHEKTHELYNQVPQPNQDNIIKNLIVGEKNWNKYLGDYKYYSQPTEVAARLNQFRKRYNIDPNKKYTPEEMRTIIDAHKNRYSSGVSSEDMDVDYNSGDTGIDQLFNIIGDDPAKLAELNDRIVMNQQAAGADMAKWGGPTRMNRFGYLVDRKANGGSPYPINLNLPQYKQPSGFFTGYTYGNSPQANVNIYGVGAYGEKRVSPRTTLSGDISSQSVTYPGGSQMFNKPTYGVGMKYRFDEGGVPCPCPEYNCNCLEGYERLGNAKLVEQLNSINGLTAMQPFYDDLYSAANKYSKDGKVSGFNAARAVAKSFIKHPNVLFMKRHLLPGNVADENPYKVEKFSSGKKNLWQPTEWAEPVKEHRGLQDWFNNIKTQQEDNRMRRKAKRDAGKTGCWGANCYDVENMDQAEYGGLTKYKIKGEVDDPNKPYDEKVFNNFPTPYSNEFVDKYQKDYNTFYTPPRYYGHDDGYDAYLHSIKGKAPFNTTIQEDLGPTWEYRGTHMQTKNFPSDWQRRIDKGKATKEDFKYYPNYIQDQNIGDTQAAGLTHYLQSQSKKPSSSFYKNGGDISIPKLPNTKGPLLQFYYAKTGGELVGRSRKKA